MENTLIYLFKSAGILAMFYLSFKLWLSKETFFNHNRWYLLFGVLAAGIFPLITYTKTILVDPVAIEGFSFNATTAIQNTQEPTLSWSTVMFTIYALGVVFFALRFCLQLATTFRLIHAGKKEKQGKFTYVAHTNVQAPFSFFNFIVYDPEFHTEEDLNTILSHERIHVVQKHSFDMMLCQALLVIQWCNPFAWWYQKTLTQNLEFLTDAKTVSLSNSKQQYQYALLKQATANTANPIVNSFYSSFIKKRIVMLNKNQSKKVNLLKFSFIAPFLVAFVFLFNTKTIAQTKTAVITKKVVSPVTEMTVSVTIKSTSTDEELSNGYGTMFKDLGIDLKFKAIKRNNAGEITSIKASYNTNEGKSGKYHVKTNTPIKSFAFYAELNDDESVKNAGFKLVEEKKGYVTVRSKYTDDAEEKTYKVSTIEYNDDEDHPEKGHTTISINNFKVTDDQGNEKILIDTENNVRNATVIIDGEKVSTDSVITFVVKDIKDLDFDIVKPGAASEKDASLVFKNGAMIINTKKDTELSFISAKDIDASTTDSKTIVVKASNVTPLFIVDGEIQETSFDANAISPDDIASMNVLKGKSAIAIYGDQGENGVIQIITKKEAAKIEVSSDDAKPIYVIDGKIKDGTAIKEVSPDQIEAVKVLKGEKAIAKYGSKGKNGVIEITLKKKEKS